MRRSPETLDFGLNLFIYDDKIDNLTFTVRKFIFSLIQLTIL